MTEAVKSELAAEKSPEQVLVIPAQSLFDITTDKGFLPLAEHPRLKNLIYPLTTGQSRTEYRDRPAMEKDPSFKQLIPYLVFLTGATGIEEIFHYTRSKLQGEQRLHGKRSVGVGGHINNESGPESYYMGMCREFYEELGISIGGLPHSVQLPIEGFLYDESTEVNSVHLGVVHVARIPSDVDIRFQCEESMAEPGFYPLRRALEEIELYETWSQLVIRWLVGA